MTVNTAPPPNWQDLYQQAMLEIDPARVPALILQANEAILQRIERNKGAFSEDEIIKLCDALFRLRLLRREYRQGLKEYRKLQNQKLG
jgi:hypothetical protein